MMARFTEEEVSLALSAAMRSAFAQTTPPEMTQRQRDMIRFYNLFRMGRRFSDS